LKQIILDISGDNVVKLEEKISHNIILFLTSHVHSNRKIIVIISIVIAALLIDTALDKISDLIRPQSDSSWIIALFIAIGVIYVIGQHLVLRFIELKREAHRRMGVLPVSSIHTVVMITQYSLSVIVVFIILQILLRSHYNTVILFLSTVISYTLAIAMLVTLSQLFFSWFKSKRDPVILLYGLSAVSLAINTIVTLALAAVIWPGVPPEVAQHVATLSRLFTDPIQNFLNNMNFVSSIISFVITWSATAILLRHYSKRIGRTKYWIIVSIPLVYFASQFPTLFLHVFAPLLIANPAFFGILLTLIFFLSKTAGGILFGIAFLTIAKSLTHNRVVRNYMVISAYGLILLFISNQAIELVNAPYPPFGLVTVSFVGLSSYLLLVGIYSSAISVAQDLNLRKSIRKVAIKESELLDNIGTAQMGREIHRKVITITKEHQDIMQKETGIESSLNEDDMKDYLSEVLKELKTKKEERQR
jgi:hypothetical protein